MATAITSTPASVPNSEPVPGYRDHRRFARAFGRCFALTVRFQPWPGTATVRDVVAVHDAENRLCELVDGVLVEKVMGFDGSIYAVLLSASIVAYLETHDLGKVIGADGLMRIFPEIVRIPDTAFISWRRIPKANGDRGSPPGCSRPGRGGALPG